MLYGAEFDYNWTINDGVLRVDYTFTAKNIFVTGR